MKTIYLDMDGVLTDYEGRMIALYGLNKRERYTQTNWDDFIKYKNFETLDMLLSAYVLLDFVKTCNANVEILSSSGGSFYHTDVAKQKKNWLIKHNIPYVANIVTSGFKKAEYANPNVILVDDTISVVDNFKDNGGNVILHDHTNVYHTIDLLKKFLEDKM